MTFLLPVSAASVLLADQLTKRLVDWYLLLAPVAVLAVLLLFRFVGCHFDPQVGSESNYAHVIKADSPFAYFRLQEQPGDTIAKNEVGTQAQAGLFETAQPPLDAGEPTWRSTEVAKPHFELGVTDPNLVQTESGSSAIRVDGGFIHVPSDLIANLTEFTLEVLVNPEWDVAFQLGKYYCVMESAASISIPGLPPPTQKNAGFGIYAGPDTFDPTSPYAWQFWMGVGADGFERLFPKPFTQPPNNPVPNPGPIVQPEPTYLAVTFSQSQSQAFLYVFTPNQDIDYTTYELNTVPYVPVTRDLLIGISREGPLFQPFPGSPVLLYPFKGLIGQVAIYDRVLDPGQLRNHVINAFFNI
jgi:hypothetical protein